MTFQLTVGILLAYIVPGLIVAWGTAHLIENASNFFLRFLENPSTGSALAISILIFAFGAITDSIRALFIDWLLDGLQKTKPPANYLQKLNKDNLPVFLMLIERTQEYYRLNSNSCLALTFLLVAMLVKFRCTYYELLVLLGLIAMFFAAWKSRKETLWAMDQFSKS